MINLEEVYDGVIGAMFLSDNTFSDVDFDYYLDSRDSASFDVRWTESYKLIAELENKEMISDECKIKIDTIREVAYKMALKYTGDPDLSGYISDDFDLIARAAALGVDKKFISGLFESYKSGRLPGTKTE